MLSPAAEDHVLLEATQVIHRPSSFTGTSSVREAFFSGSYSNMEVLVKAVFL